MGNSASKSSQARAAKARSDAIDRELDEELKRFYKRYCKILVLGTAESGRSTFVRQMKIVYQNGFTSEELMGYRPMIYRNTVDNAHAIVRAMQKMNVDYINPLNRANADKIMGYRVDPSPHFTLSPEIAQAIHELWQDPIMHTVLDNSRQFHLTDNAAYFFDEVLRIGTHDYLPTVDDVLRAPANSTGIMSAWFNMGELSWSRLISHRQRKWIHCFESATSVIICVALSDYDQMEESLALFESVVNSRWFLRTSIILFLTKIDVFKAKFQKAELEKYFPEYTGGRDVNEATKFILWKFMQANRARLSIYPHLTQVTDTSNIRLVFAAVKETILRNALIDSEILDLAEVANRRIGDTTAEHQPRA